MPAISRESIIRLSSYVLAGLALIGVLMLHLLVPLLFGLLVHELLRYVTPFAERRFSTRWGKMIVVVGFAARWPAQWSD
jgi:hypothetical protein